MSPGAAVVLAAMASILLVAPAMAIEVQRLDVSADGGQYSVRFDATLDAPLAQVLRVLRDYAHYPELDSRIREARLLADPAGQRLLYTRLRGCVGKVFCSDLRRTERVTELGNGAIAAAIPEQSDVRFGLTTTELYAEGERTRVRYTSRFVPQLWIPDFVVRGPMLAALEDGTRRLFTNVEARARRGAPP